MSCNKLLKKKSPNWKKSLVHLETKQDISKSWEVSKERLKVGYPVKWSLKQKHSTPII